MVWQEDEVCDLNEVERIANGFHRQKKLLRLVTQWPLTLEEYFTLYPEVRSQPPRRFKMLLGPAAAGKAGFSTGGWVGFGGQLFEWVIRRRTLTGSQNGAMSTQASESGSWLLRAKGGFPNPPLRDTTMIRYPEPTLRNPLVVSPSNHYFAES